MARRSALVPALVLLSLAAVAFAASESKPSFVSQGPIKIPSGEDGGVILYDGYPRLAAMVGWISISVSSSAPLRRPAPSLFQQLTFVSVH